MTECTVFIARTINDVVEANSGSGFLHKSKLNTNGTFSVGKTWRLSELRAIQVVNVSLPCFARMCRNSMLT